MSHQQRSEVTRSRILGAAADCFAHAGYDATGLAEICRQAGVSKGAFYHHFPSKQAAFLALLEQWLRGLDAPLYAARLAGETVPERLLALAGMVHRVFESARGQFPIFLEFWRQAAREPEVWRMAAAPYRRFREGFAALIAEGVAEGTLRPVDPDAAAGTLVSLGAGLVLQGVVDDDDTDWGAAAEGAVRLLLEGIGADKR